MNTTNTVSLPFKFKSNRVRRLYQGGSGIDRLHGKTAVADTNYPEDWIASCVEGNTREFVAHGHGLSTCENKEGEHSFPQLLREQPETMLGSGHYACYGANPGVLTKLLDSAVLLPLQVHPDSVCARRLFHDEYGKTEAWIIIATREINAEKPYLLLGFNECLDPDVFRRESLNGEFHTALDMLHKFEVKPGNVFVVYGRMPHAIGPGITMVEVMEPTDYVIIPEKNSFGRGLSTEKRFAGLPPETALGIFDFTAVTREEVISRCCPEAELIEKNSAGILHRIISRRKVKFFEVQKLHFNGVWNLDLTEKTFRIGIVVSGRVTLNSGMELSSGESFFLPYAINSCQLKGRADIIFILPPEKQTDRDAVSH